MAQTFTPYYTTPFVETYGASLTTDPSVRCSSLLVTGNIALNITVGILDNEPYRLILTNNAVGSPYVVTWGANISAASPTLTLTLLKTFICDFVFYGSKWYLTQTPVGL